MKCLPLFLLLTFVSTLGQAAEIERIWLSHRTNDPSKIVVSWTTDEPGDSVVRYGLTPNHGEIVRVDEEVTLHHVEIPLKQRDATYHYSVSSGDQQSTNATFKAYPTDELRVGVVADWQGKPDLSAIVKDDVHLLLTAGDNIARLWDKCGEGNKDCVKPFAELIDAYPKLFRSTPFMPVLGNHDREIRPRRDEPPAEPVYDVDATAFRRFFELPDDEWKWHFDLPEFNLRVVVLDFNHISDFGTTWQTCHPFDENSAQLEWYSKLMEQPPGFVVTLYNERNSNIRNQADGKWHDLFRRGTLCVSGFGYFAERAEVNGFPYYNTALNGRGNQYPDPHSEFLAGEDSYVLLTVEREGNMIADIKSLDGEVLDRREYAVSRPETAQAEPVKDPASPDASHAKKAASSRTAEDASCLAIFEKRILPILQSPKPSSCSDCHLSGVNLADYIRPTQQETFASLVSADLIDTKKPDDSKILTFISRRPDKPSIVTEKVRQQEYEAFRAWIHAAVEDPMLLAAKGDAGPVGPRLPIEVIRHARQDRVLASFVENVWTEVSRCAACHSPDRNQKQVKEHGEQVSWITLNAPQKTLDYMLEAGLIDTEQPHKSLLLTKPTMQVDHGGGQKMVVGDRTYKQFRRFIDDYAATVNGQYDKADQLPEPSDEVSVVTDTWLKIEGVPAKYDKMLLQADLYRQTDSGWSEFRVATSDRPVFGPKNLWQHSLGLTAPRSSKSAEQIGSEQLPPGKYLVKLYVDQDGKLQRDFTAQLGDEDFVGQVEVESRWPAGYGKMTVVQFPTD